jgi:membrane protein DedA with SNARE-associated domain
LFPDATPDPVSAVAAAEGLRALWPYATLGATAFVGSELVPLLAGFAAEQGHLSFAPLVFSVAAGAWVVAVGLYFVGRWRAGWVRLKLRAAPPIVRSIRGILRSNPWRSTVLARFAFGGRILLPLACGAAHLPVWIFLTGTAIAAVIWAWLFAALGWFFGQSAVAVVGHIREAEQIVAAVVLAGMFLALFLMIRKRQKRASLPRKADPRA